MAYDNMWTYNDAPYEEITDGMIGFVYIITNKTNQMKYIGKKNFYFSKTKQVKKVKIKYKAESDWKIYYGSSELLLSEIEKYGKESFTREIVRICKSKSEFAYFEAYHQFVNHAILRPNDYYNEWISCRMTRRHLKKMILSGETFI